MFLAGKTLIVTTEELFDMVGELKRLPDGTLGITREQMDKFTHVTIMYLLRKKDMYLTGLIMSVHYGVFLVILLNLWIGVQGVMMWPLMVVLAVTFILQLFRKKVVFWMTKRCETMIVHVTKDGESSTKGPVRFKGVEEGS